MYWIGLGLKYKLSRQLLTQWLHCSSYKDRWYEDSGAPGVELGFLDSAY